MAWNINSAKLTIEIIDDTTGEIITREATLGDFKEVTAKKKATSSKKVKIDDSDPNPKITLLDGKVQFNKAAVDLTGFEPDMKIDIKFDKKGKKQIPVMMREENSGNRLTKSYTISCRGSRHDDLLKYGDVFELEPYPEKDGYFYLKGNKAIEDDIIEVPQEISEPEDDFSDEDFDLDL